VERVVRVRKKTHVHQLNNDSFTRFVYGVGDESPSRDVLGAVDAGGERMALAVGARLGALTDDERHRRALGVVGRVDLCGHAF
jgi:hypothetical protein